VQGSEQMQGAYVLVMEVDREQTIPVGRLGNIWFPSGSYAYVGSAMGGLENRINRHLRSEKKLHWHIDYLLKYARVDTVYIKEGRDREECDIARWFHDRFDCIPSFGSSDCKCPSHLYISNGSTRLIQCATELGMVPFEVPKL